MILKSTFRRLFKPAGEADAGGGGAEPDRGDHFEPTDDDAATAIAATAAKDAAAAAEKATKDAETAAAAVAAAAAGATGDDDTEVDEDDPVAVAAAAVAAAKKGKDTRMPVARHKEILERERALRQDLETKLEKYEKGAAVAATNEQIEAAETNLLKLEADYAKLIVDGDHQAAAKVMGEIRSTERGISAAKTTMLTQAAEANAYERVRYDMTVERLEAAYPVLNPDDKDNYDEAKVADVMELQAAYRTAGRTPANALQKACEVILGKSTAKQTAAVEVKPRVDAEEVAKKLAEDRRKAAIAKNLDAAGKQPASTTAAGVDSDKAGGTLRAADAVKLKHEEFIKLPDSELSRLRGDVIA